MDYGAGGYLEPVSAKGLRCQIWRYPTRRAIQKRSQLCHVAGQVGEAAGQEMIQDDMGPAV